MASREKEIQFIYNHHQDIRTMEEAAARYETNLSSATVRKSADAAQSTGAYDSYIARAQGQGKEESRVIYREMLEKHNEIVRNMVDNPAMATTITTISTDFRAAREAILAGKKGTVTIREPQIMKTASELEQEETNRAKDMHDEE